MRKGDVDWKQFATDLLWFNIVSHKNEYSGYDLVTSGDGSQPYWREKKGDIVRDVRFRSSFAPPTKQLTWKELALELGLFEDILTPDGHAKFARIEKGAMHISRTIRIRKDAVDGKSIKNNLYICKTK